MAGLCAGDVMAAAKVSSHRCRQPKAFGVDPMPLCGSYISGSSPGLRVLVFCEAFCSFPSLAAQGFPSVPVLPCLTIQPALPGQLIEPLLPGTFFSLAILSLSRPATKKGRVQDQNPGEG
jgi:hypothetical protein